MAPSTFYNGPYYFFESRFVKPFRPNGAPSGAESRPALGNGRGQGSYVRDLPHPKNSYEIQHFVCYHIQPPLAKGARGVVYQAPHGSESR